MTKTNTTKEEIITVHDQPSQQVVKKTTRQVRPQIEVEPAQRVYEKKKTIFRYNQIIWYILGFVETLLAFRIILKALGANSSIGFTNFIYSITTPFAAPFSGILEASISRTSIIEWSTIIAGLVYLSIAWGLIYLLDLIYPITPKDV